MLRRTLARVLDATGILDAQLGWIGARWLPSIAYHRIHPHPEGQPFDRGVIDATARELDWQLTALTQHFTPVGASQIAHYLRDGIALPNNPALVTFDDGYRECVTSALPVLKKHGVRASFFIATSYVEQRRVFWWDRISYTVRRSRKDLVRLVYPRALVVRLTPDPEHAVRVLLRIVKSTYDIDLERFLTELTDAAGVPWSRDMEQRLAADLLMTWDDVRALRDAGMEIGSHTRTHRILQNVCQSELDSELTGSRKDLEDELKQPVIAVSYPVGRSIVGTPSIVRAVERAGYEIGFSTGLAHVRSPHQRFNLGRVMLDPGLAPASFRALLAHPFFAG